MPEARPEEEPAEEEAADEPADAELDLELESLTARGDVSGLLALARAFRNGSTPYGRDMKRCLDAYRAAATLGSADAEYAVALFSMTGGVVPQDPNEGAARLRAASDKGSIPAKVYLGNLYELGIHYKIDAEKADVWYRNAARSARIGAEPGSSVYARSLAELGCVRYVLALVESGAVTGDDKTRLLQRARAHGYGLRLKASGDQPVADRTRSLTPDDDASSPGVDDAPTDEAPRDRGAPETDGRSAARERHETTPETRAAKAARGRATKQDDASRSSKAFSAFAYAALFTAAGTGAAYACMAGARELATHDALHPTLEAHPYLVFAIVFGLVGVVPTWFVYRFGAVLKALLIGAVLGGVGWVAWGTEQATFHDVRSVQSLLFGLAGFLVGLLVLGFMGGTRPRSSKRPSTE